MLPEITICDLIRILGEFPKLPPTWPTHVQKLQASINRYHLRGIDQPMEHTGGSWFLSATFKLGAKITTKY